MNRTLALLSVSAITAIAAAGFATATVHADDTTPPPWDFYGVPQLGTEPVRGTGCGGDGSVGDVIPDGYWRGYLSGDNGASIEFDLACVYFNAVPNSMPMLDGWLVNNKTRTRTVPTSPTYVLAESDYDEDGSVPLAAAQPTDTIGPSDVRYATSEAWLYIENGQAQWAIWAPRRRTYGDALEVVWQSFSAVDQQRLCNEVAPGGGVPPWAMDALPDWLTQFDLENFAWMVTASCEPSPTPIARALPPTIVAEPSGVLFWTDPAFSHEPYGQQVHEDESGAWYFLSSGQSRYYLTDEDVWGTGDGDGDGINDLADLDDSDGPAYDHCGC